MWSWGAFRCRRARLHFTSWNPVIPLPMGEDREQRPSSITDRYVVNQMQRAPMITVCRNNTWYMLSLAVAPLMNFRNALAVWITAPLQSIITGGKKKCHNIYLTCSFMQCSDGSMQLIWLRLCFWLSHKKNNKLFIVQLRSLHNKWTATGKMITS